MKHASPARSKFPLLVSVALLGGLVTVGGVGRAIVDGVDSAATAESPAERIVVSGEGALFPIDPVPRCEVLNNFGGYSKYQGGNGHQGVDIGADEYQEVYAVERGTLVDQYTDSGAAGFGWKLLSVTDVQYRYYHLAAFAEGLEVGDEVEKGQLIGYVGDTGNATPSGWHLHFEMRPGPEYDPIDPVPELDVPTVCNVY